MRGNSYRGVMAFAFVLGGAAGYLIGVLAAPASRAATRKGSGLARAGTRPTDDAERFARGGSAGSPLRALV